MNPTIKTIIRVVAILLILAGGVWLLQGMNILPGSYMTGDPQWTINGGVTVGIGMGLFWYASRK
jgi:uncharacterized membrane protein